MHKTYQAKNFGIVCGKKNDRGGRNIFIFRSEIGSVTGGIRRHGRIYRFADAIFYRLGLCRSFSLGFRRREYPAVQFRGRAGDSGADGARPFALSVRCRFGEYARRYDLLLDRAFGQVDDLADPAALYKLTSDYSVSVLQEWREEGGSICHLLEVTAGNTEYANGLLRMNVIDEIILYVVPTIDGNGAHFFKSALPMNDWRLMENKTYRDGVIRLTYHKEPRA